MIKGFCWIDVNSTYLKARLKRNGVFDVLSMTLFTMTQLPGWYYVSLINTEVVRLYIDNFINNTFYFQINDARQLPIVMPTQQQLSEIKEVCDEAFAIKRSFFSSTLSKDEAEEKLACIQKEIDKLALELYQI